jgi:adenylate kinase family enzyme
MVIGCGGAGKSTFARELATRTGLPLIHLDREFWKPGWVPTPPDEWDEHLSRLSSADAWIMDGNYGRTLTTRLQRCDAVVFFDLPRVICLQGIFKRWLRSQFKRRPDLPEGCAEQLDVEFVRWVWDYPRNSRPRIVAALANVHSGASVLTVTRRTQTREILAAVSNGVFSGG